MQSVEVVLVLGEEGAFQASGTKKVLCPVREMSSFTVAGGCWELDKAVWDEEEEKRRDVTTHLENSNPKN